MRHAGRIKLGHYPLPVEEAENIRTLLLSSEPYAAIDPCVGDGTALIEITKDSGACPAGIELDADRAAAAATKGISTIHGSAFECRVLAETCSLLYLNPLYDSEFGPHGNKEDGAGVPGTLLSLGDQRGCSCIRRSGTCGRHMRTPFGSPVRSYQRLPTGAPGVCPLQPSRGDCQTEERSSAG